MTTWRLVAAATGVLLALAPSAAVCAAPGVPAAGPVSRTAAVAPAAPTVRCPRPAAPSPVKRPTRPSPPAVDPVLRTVGGEALATGGLAAPGGAKAPPAVSATSWLVADLDSGAVLGGCGPHEYAIPASVQKLLLAVAVLPRLDPKRVVTITQDDLDFEPGSSAVGLLLDGKYSVELLWLGLMLNSGNDAANVLARLGGGDAGVAGTVQAMNAEARRLGAYQTKAVTPSGLDGPGQFTSAYDLALIARAAFANPTFRRYTATQRVQIPPQPPQDKKGFQIQNDNQLLFDYPGALGGKTGFTDLARHTYVGFAERGGRRLVVTVLGAETVPLRGWQQGAALLDWGFGLPGDASVGRLVQPGEPDPRDQQRQQQGEQAAAQGDRTRVSRTADANLPRSQALVPNSAWTTGAAAGVALALVVGPLVVLAVTRRGRRRSARRRRIR